MRTFAELDRRYLLAPSNYRCAFLVHIYEVLLMYTRAFINSSRSYTLPHFETCDGSIITKAVSRQHFTTNN